MEVKFQNLDRLYSELKNELDEAYFTVMKNGTYIMGNELKLFEESYSKYCHSKYCVGTSSGLDALTIALRSLKIDKGSEVLVPADTYIATFIAVYNAGLKPVPIDVDEKTLEIDTNKIESKINNKTGVIMPVHLYYQTADMDEINNIAERYNLSVVTDAAQAHGAKYKKRIAGSLAETECFSFFPTKNLGALGDAGCIITKSEDIYEKSLELRNYGTKKRYISEVIGYNSRLDELQASFLREKLKYLDKWNQRRRYIAHRYITEIKGNNITLPYVAEYANPNWYIFPIFSKARDLIKSKLEKMGITTIVHYPVPPHLQPAFAYLHYNKHSFPVSYEIANTELSLPMHPYLTDVEVDYIINAINVIG